MTRSRRFGLLLLLLALLLLVSSIFVALTPAGNAFLAQAGLVQATDTPTPTPRPHRRITSTPTPSPQPILTVQGPPPNINAGALYLQDMDTGNVLADTNGEKPLPMASTTKIMTALIAIQTGRLEQAIPVQQDAYNRVGYQIGGGTVGSTAGLQVGEKVLLKDMLYALLLPSGDDAAVAIADALGGTHERFVERMNLLAYRLHLFQTHYITSDGLILNDDDNANHYTTAHDLAQLALYAMKDKLFAQIVATTTYSIPANGQHQAHTWQTTNTLLTTYPGMSGIKTGHTDAAGWCLVFAATRNDHHLLGVLLNSTSEQQRNIDVRALLDWGFGLPLLPPHL